MRILPVLLIAVLLGVLIPAGHGGAAAEKIQTVIEGPTTVITDEEYEYTIKIVGLPDADMWSYTANVTGGGSAVPDNGTSSTTNEFTVKIRAPPAEGDFTIEVNGTAKEGNTTYWHIVRYKVSAAKPYIVKVELYNSGSMDANNVSVSLYVDEKFQYRTTANIPSGKSSTIDLKWNTIGFSKGVHKLRIVLDDRNNLTFFGNGATEIVKEVYLGDVPKDTTGTWLALAVLFSAGAIASFMSFRKKKKKMKRKKW